MKLFFLKKPSVGDVPRLRFLIHMAKIAKYKSALEMAWGPKYDKSINKKIYIVGDMGEKMAAKHCHISGPRPFIKLRI